jgi:pyruvate formate lyase activating enzyme
MKSALFWKALKGKKVKCQLCPRFCTISDGQFGVCRARKNQKGKLYSAVYSLVCAVHVDPIEKKPFYHFAPGTKSLSISTTGCNLLCKFCQNWEISAAPEPFGENIEPEKIVELAKSYGVPGIAYTYTEPTVFFEYALDTMKLAKKEGLYNIWVSNGYINSKPARLAAKWMDGINVDMKGDMHFYKELCGIADEEPIKKALKIYREQGVWIEITNLIIPNHNDASEQIKKLVNWIKTNLGSDTPLHFSRFYPYYKMLDVSPTPVETLERALNIAKKAGLKWVYIGNVAGHKAESSWCPRCGTLLIERKGYDVRVISEKCSKCGESIPIKGKEWMK